MEANLKKIIFLALMTLSLSSYSQSYLILDNGIVITEDKAGYMYDFGHYAFPQKITLKGGRYFVEENAIIATVDDNGLLYRKYEVIPEKVIGKGVNYFLGSEGELYTVNRSGVVKINQYPELKLASIFGGNFFAVPQTNETNILDLYVINQDGERIKTSNNYFKSTEIVVVGGSYFMTNRGIAYTVSYDGVVTGWPQLRVGLIAKKGGNYFTDSSGTIFTIAEDGTLKVPVIPVGLKVSLITKLGSNYFIDINGRLFSVDENGEIFERSLLDQDLRYARILSL
jgi:hypothetical protein